MTIFHHPISQAGWNRCNLSIYLSCTSMDNTKVLIYRLISQAGWNRCHLSIFLSILWTAGICVPWVHLKYFEVGLIGKGEEASHLSSNIGRIEVLPGILAVLAQGISWQKKMQDCSCQPLDT